MCPGLRGSVFTIKKKIVAKMEMRVAGNWPFGTLWKLAAAVTTVRVRERVVHRDRVCISLSG